MKRLLNTRFVIASLFFLILISAVVAFATNQFKTGNDPKIENKTQALVIESAAKSGRDGNKRIFNVTVKNNSEKSIVSYSFRIVDSSMSKNSVSGLERSGVIDGWSLPPQQSDTNSFSVAAKGEAVITIEAVMFEDGSVDGERAATQRLQEISEGVGMAYRQILPILRRASNQNETAVLENTLQSLEEEIVAISDATVPAKYKAGFIDAKNYISHKVEEIKSKPDSNQNRKYASEISEQTAKIEKTLARLENSNKSSFTEKEDK